MKKNSKKVLLSLTATMLLASSVGHAQSFNYRNTTYYSNYNNQSNRKVYVVNYDNYSNNYLQQRYNNVVIKYNPIYWEYDFNNNQSTETEIPSKDNDTSDNDINKERENNNTTSETITDKPNTNTTIGANTSIEMEIVRLVNTERQKEGLAPLTYSEELSKVARIKSQDMANNNYFSHNSPTYGDPFTMMKSFGIQYKTAGENIAKGYSSAQSVMNGWMNSSGHRANILNPSFGKIGVGYVNVNGTTYWTQMFTN